MNSDFKAKIPFKREVRVNEKEIQGYLPTFVDEYRNITLTDLPYLYDQFPLWSYPVRIVAGITQSNVYFFITRDGNPSENRTEIYGIPQRRELARVWDDLEIQIDRVASVLKIASSISTWYKQAKEGGFDDNAAKADAAEQVTRHYRMLADKGEVSPHKFSEAKVPEYLPPVIFLENHVESTELKDKIKQMLEGAKQEIMIAGWLDTYMLDELQKKNKEHIPIQIITRQPDKGGPMPNRTAYKRITEIAQVRRNELWHFRMLICDKKEVLVSSADLTTHSLTQNFEAGLWTSSPAIVDRAVVLFGKVWNHKETIDVNQEVCGKR